jgi:hypothetical protein
MYRKSHFSIHIEVVMYRKRHFPIHIEIVMYRKSHFSIHIELTSVDIFMAGNERNLDKGMIPEGWKICKLGDIAEIIMGQSPGGKTCHLNIL